MFPPIQIPKLDTKELIDYVKNLTPEEEQKIIEEVNFFQKKNRQKEFLSKMKSWLKTHWLTILGWLITNLISVMALIVAILSYLKQ